MQNISQDIKALYVQAGKVSSSEQIIGDTKKDYVS
jgi:hypothetical protein